MQHYGTKRRIFAHRRNPQYLMVTNSCRLGRRCYWIGFQKIGMHCPSRVGKKLSWDRKYSPTISRNGKSGLLSFELVWWKLFEEEGTCTFIQSLQTKWKLLINMGKRKLFPKLWQRRLKLNRWYQLKFVIFSKLQII